MSLKNIFLILALIFVAIGIGTMFIGHGTSSTPAIIQGIAKGLAGVFFILYYILMLFGKQPMDKTGAEHF